MKEKKPRKADQKENLIDLLWDSPRKHTRQEQLKDIDNEEAQEGTPEIVDGVYNDEREPDQ